MADLAAAAVAHARFSSSGRGQQHPDGKASDDARSPPVLQEEGFHRRGNDPGNSTESIMFISRFFLPLFM